jgi:tRNA (guanosine-2'-O-)-methyltransferase
MDFESIMEEWQLSVDEFEEEPKRSLRQKANNAKILRCKTLICILENPRNLQNVGTVIRNIDTLGIGKLYIVDGFKLLPNDWESIRKMKELKHVSSTANKWAFVKRFDTTKECFEHLKENNFTSICTSPHIKGQNNVELYQGDFTQSHLAVWFGNESHGISTEVIDNCAQCVQIEMSGIIESLNLACSTGIVLWHIAQKRREYYPLSVSLNMKSL